MRRLACLFGLAGLLALPLEAVARSKLSRWVFDSTVPAIQELFERHPRYADSGLEIRAAGANGLDEALASALRAGLERRGVELRRSLAPLQLPVDTRSVDALNCAPAPVAAHRLLVSAREQGAVAEVSLSLVDTAEAATELRNWHWRGALDPHERDTIRRPAAAVSARGTLTAPWSRDDAEAAADALSRQLACALRPAVAGQLRLHWDAEGVTGFHPTWLELRRRIGAYAEFADVDAGGDYRVELRPQQVQPGVWQLWLAGIPQRPQLPAVQAVTYARAPGPEPALAAAPTRPAPVQVPLRRPAAGEPASRYFQVELLDAAQDRSRPGRATLSVRLRLHNTAGWPLRYGLSLSGGHFRHCVAEPGYYRHDRYGYLEGELGAGESTVRVMTIDGARHNPRPWFGMRRCAGFRDLDGFEDFAGHGRKVTQFIHWNL